MSRDARLGLMIPLFALALASLLMAAAPDDSPSALERSPDGWVDLIAEGGPQLKGWTRVAIPKEKALAERSQWSVDKDGRLVCEGNGGHEWLRWDQEVGDAIFHVEWRFTAVPGKKGYNSGIYARNSADGTLWHQAQTGDASGGYLFGNTLVGGKQAPLKADKSSGHSRVKPAGEWNTFEIRAQGKTMALWVNGAVTSEWTTCEVPKGYVGVEAEGFRIEFRNVKLRKL